MGLTKDFSIVSKAWVLSLPFQTWEWSSGGPHPLACWLPTHSLGLKLGGLSRNVCPPSTRAEVTALRVKITITLQDLVLHLPGSSAELPHLPHFRPCPKQKGGHVP